MDGKSFMILGGKCLLHVIHVHSATGYVYNLCYLQIIFSMTNRFLLKVKLF